MDEPVDAEKMRLMDQGYQQTQQHERNGMIRKRGPRPPAGGPKMQHHHFVGRPDRHARAEATSIIRGQRAITSLKIRATPTLSNKWLLPRLGRYLDAHPELEVRLDGTNEPTDFNRELVDVEIRHGDGRWPGLFVEGLGPESFVPVSAPGLAAAGSLTPEEVMRFRLIRSVKSQAQWPRWLTDAGVQHNFDWKAVLFDRSHMAIDAACDGMGIALESNLMMWRELRDGLLVNPVRGAPEIRLTTQWIVCPTDHLRLKRVRVFLDWLREEYRIWSETEAILP